MFSGYIVLAFLFMGLLFVRHILIYKEENKINYAPLVITIGIISSIIHFISYPENKDLILLLRESFFPLVVSLFLYLVMNILHQTQSVKHSLVQLETTQDLIHQISELKSFTVELEKEMLSKQEEEILAQKELRDKFNKDIKSLEVIQTNQIKFLEKFDEMAIWHKDISDRFNDFTEIQLPALDGIVHRHIETLRIDEKEHFKKVITVLETALENKCDIKEHILEASKKLDSMKNMANDISLDIKKHTLSELTDVTKAFEHQIVSLKSHTESINTTLYESEHSLEGIKEQSEMIVKQMLLSSKKLETLETQSDKLYDTYLIMKELINNIESIKLDYANSKDELSEVAKKLQFSDEQSVMEMKALIGSISIELNKKIEEALEKLYDEYHIAKNDVSKSVQMLTQKNKLKGYANLDEDKI